MQLGGTIGDIEGMPFVEAFRQFQFRAKRENFACVHVSLIPQVGLIKTSVFFIIKMLYYENVCCLMHLGYRENLYVYNCIISMICLSEV